MKIESPLEREFLFICKTYNLPTPERECHLIPERRFRWDFCWREQKVAVELQGGIFSGGRHTRGAGYILDMEKNNLAVLSGWRVLYFTSFDLKRNPKGVVEKVKALLTGKDFPGTLSSEGKYATSTN